MAFTTRRGRPRSDKPRNDMGTPELILKRAYMETMESIDLCLERHIITHKQHWCGLHLRWLYTLRYGAPNVSATELNPIDGFSPPSDDSPIWRAAREAEWSEALAMLKEKHRERAVMEVCIYNERPSFLHRSHTMAASRNPQLIEKIEKEINRLREGLDLLVEHWGA